MERNSNPNNDHINAIESYEFDLHNKPTVALDKFKNRVPVVQRERLVTGTTAAGSSENNKFSR